MLFRSDGEETFHKRLFSELCEEELTRFSFPISSEPVGELFVDELMDQVVDQPTIPFSRSFDD